MSRDRTCDRADGNRRCALELGGLWLVWHDIKRDRQRAGELLRRRRRPPRERRQYPMRFSAPVASQFAGLESQTELVAARTVIDAPPL
jgi:hypothetical protein